MARTIIQLIKACASKLRDSKLQRLGSKEISANLEALVQRLKFNGREEAIVFTAIFDRNCIGRPCDLDDVADYFDCPHLDVMEYIPAIRSLIERGMISIWNPSECNIASQRFQIPALIMNSLLENHIPEPCSLEIISPKFDRYDFCRLVDDAIQDSDVSALGLMQTVANLETSNPNMLFVRKVKEELAELSDRVLFYDICYDFYNQSNSDIERTLSDMYESFGVRFSERRKLLDGSSALLQAELVEHNDRRSEVTLSDKGQKILLEDDYSSFGARYDCSNRYGFAKAVRSFFHDNEKYNSDMENSQAKLEKSLTKLENSNLHLSCVNKTIDIIPAAEDRVIFYMVCESCPGGIDVSRELRKLFPINKALLKLNEFKEEKHELQRLDFVEIRSESSLFGECTMLTLTDKGKELFFEEDAKIFMEKSDSKNIISCTDIVPKSLYFSEEQQRQLSMVGESLQQEKYLRLVDRLDAKGLSKGIAVLLYGAPGTGKTESVMQWARSAGRDIIHVDLSASKSMWYGESEKIVKGIFTRYRNACKRSKIKPILLFNEADGLFSKRKDISSGSSVDQTENTIQNILLEEMEKLDGILVATTNLADNLDAAFERRFLFKIKLEKPAVDAKRRIWMDKLQWLDYDDAARLAASYDFSGGEIDNIVRKATMQEVLDGSKPDIDSIVRLCREERMCEQTCRKIGF